MGRTHSPGDVAYAVVIGLLGALALAILIGPVLIVLAISLTAEASLRFPPQGFSLRWYGALVDPAQSGFIHEAALNSLQVALGATALATVAAGCAALWLRTRVGALGRATDLAFMSPLVLPMLSFGLASLIVLTMMRERPSLFWLSIGHLVVVAPYVLRTASASLTQLSQAQLDSSASLGASRFYTFRRITAPILAPGLAAGAFLAFMASVDNVPVSLFLSGARSDMLPIRMWGMMESSLDVRVAAASGVLVVTTTLLLIAMNRLVGLGRRMSG